MADLKPIRSRVAGGSAVAVQPRANRRPAAEYRGGYSRQPLWSEVAVFKEVGIPAKSVPFPDSVTPEVQALLAGPSKRQPYTHQAEVHRLALEEEANVVLTTRTASGKTLAFLGVVLTRLQKDPQATAMIWYPMNALVADQAKNLRDLGFKPDPEREGLLTITLGGVEIRAAVVTGETSPAVRAAVRRDARLVLTNPALTHLGILRQANRTYADGTSWTRILQNLGTLVQDEAHSYNGVDGTEVALTTRRLLALVESLRGRLPGVILATATIGNPAQHAENLTGLKKWVLVDKSGAQSHPREVQVVCPADHPSGDGRWAASYVAAHIVVDELRAGRKVLVFQQSQEGVQQLSGRINELWGSTKEDPVAIPYHSGFTPEHKATKIEQILRGEVWVVCTTSALELGVDIGGMDTVVLVGHPGDNASFNQRLGRVGRTAPGRVILVLDERQHPTNTYLETNPEAIFWAPENRVVYPTNPRKANAHAACALLEIGNATAVARWFPGAVMAVAKEMSKGDPYTQVAMVGRGGDLGKMRALEPDGRTVIQALGGNEAVLKWHPGAILRNGRGDVFQVVRLSVEKGEAWTETNERLTAKAYTSPQVLVTASLSQEGSRILNLPAAMKPLFERVSAGEYALRRQTVGFWRYAGEGLKPESVPLTATQRNPPTSLDTTGVEIILSANHPVTRAMVQMPVEASAVLQDVLRLGLPMVVQAHPSDVEVSVMAGSKQVFIQIYDLADGGMGWSEMAARRVLDWFQVAARVLGNCRCKMSGCPRCSLAKLKGPHRADLANALASKSC